MADQPTVTQEIGIPFEKRELAGILSASSRSRGMVIFAHGSGSSRHSPRNQYVARVLNQAGLGTLLFDLLTPAEESNRDNVFDIPMLGSRLTAATEWLHESARLSSLPIGYFGASTGAAAALWAAVTAPAPIAAVVSRGGRPDLAAERLPEVRSPTLLIVGSRDPVVLDLNRRAQERLRCKNSLAIVPGATHLFEEPGTLEEAAHLARDWFLDHLASQGNLDPPSA